MSKLFYDHLIVFEEIIYEIEGSNLHPEDKKQAKKLADEIIHHKVLIFILDHLPKAHHEEFLTRFYKAPYDLGHFKFLEEKIKHDIKSELIILGEKVKKEIFAEIKKHAHKK